MERRKRIEVNKKEKDQAKREKEGIAKGRIERESGETGKLFPFPLTFRRPNG